VYLICLKTAVLVPFVVAIVGIGFTAAQFVITSNKQDADSADKARETKEQVLTDYGKSISELVMKDKLGQKSSDESVKNIARGQTLIALRRLDPGDESKDEKDNESKVEMGVLNGLLTALNRLNPLKTDDTSKDDTSKVDTGKLKGLLIRYLYDARLIGYYKFDEKGREPVPGVMDLDSANINKVVLEDAWLAGIDLPNTWLKEANFKNANLSGATLAGAHLINADFTKANFANADFTNADLRFAKFNDPKNLNIAKLEGACYVEGTEATYFPSGFDPKKAGMVPMPKEDSDPTNPPKFKRCESVFLENVLKG
jgi:hypothetical protein